MKCKIEHCVFEAKDLSKHIIYKHNISIDKYKEIYSQEIVDKDLSKIRSNSRKDNYTIICNICGLKFSSDVSLKHHFKMSKDLKHNYYIFNELNVNDWIECKICGYRDTTIIKHILIHDLKIETYNGEVNSKSQILKLEQLQKESRQKRFKFECNICHDYFMTEKSLFKHLISNKDVEHNHLLYNETNSNEWTECKICAMRKKVLIEHLRSEHNLSKEQYEEEYNVSVYSKHHYENVFMKFIDKGAKNQQRHQTRKSHRHIECPACFMLFPSEKGLNKHIIETDDKEHSLLIYDDDEVDDWVECKFENCGCRRSRIDFHVKSKHNLNSEQYKSKYGEIFSNNYLKKVRQSANTKHESWRMSNEKNPFFNKHHTEDSKKKISESILGKRDKDKANKVLKEMVEKFDNQKESVAEILDSLKMI